LRRYTDYQRSLIEGRSFFPLYIPADKKASVDFAKMHQQLQLVISSSKDRKGYGYTLRYRKVVTRKHGEQDEIDAILFETEDDYLRFLDKAEQSLTFKQQLNDLLQWQPTLKEWLATEQPDIIHQYADTWKDVRRVVDYLLLHDVSGHYLRTLPIPVHTKFVQRHSALLWSLLKFLHPERFGEDHQSLEDALQLRKKPHLFSLRWLDLSFASQYSAGMQVFGITVEFLREMTWPLKRIILVENETNLYLFPNMAATMVLCSSGGALHLLKSIPLFHNTSLYYWGDLDEKGFTMLQEIRIMYPHIISLMMDEAVVAHHKKDMDRQPKVYRQREMTGLTPEEHRGYLMLAANQGRIEQEKLQQQYMLDRLAEL